MAATYNGRTLDQITRHDPQSLRFLVGDRLTPVPVRSRFWLPGRQLDQQQEGACVPHAVVGDALASPVRVRFPSDPQALAFTAYDWCRKNDEFPGEDYDGTSVNTGMKWYRAQGLVESWWWCKTPEELIQALIQLGPAVIGIPWREGMYETRPDGLVEVSGRVVGGHALLVNGYSPKYGKLGEVLRWKNSWGPGYGRNGHGYIRLDAFEQLAFRGEGEVAISVNRKPLAQSQLALAA
jgi:hypothetical protein